jgi:integrase
MAVYDQWHKDPRPGDQPCACGTKRRPLYPSSRHEQGLRWQVRYRDLEGKQQKKNFELKVGQDPNKHADAYDKMIAEQLRTRTYVDPALAETTLQEYAEKIWRKSRGHDVNRAAAVAGQLRNHVYPDPDDESRTPMGGVPVGQHPLGMLARTPSLTQAWIAAMPLADGSRHKVVQVVSAIYQAAIGDGYIGADPTRSKSVTRPSPGPTKARPWAARRVAAVRDALPARYRIVPELGAGTGMRQGELLGLGVDDVQFLGRRPKVRVVRQLVLVGGKLRFGPVKNRREHEVPLSPLLADALARHMAEYPPAEVTLPWHEPRDRRRHGKDVTVRLVLTAPEGGPVRRQAFDDRAWHPAVGKALAAEGAERTREDGCHALRHTFVSVQLASGTDIVRVAAMIGDTVAVTAKTYAHLMPGHDDSGCRSAVDGFLQACAPDVPPEGATGTSGVAGRV